MKHHSNTTSAVSRKPQQQFRLTNKNSASEQALRTLASSAFVKRVSSPEGTRCELTEEGLRFLEEYQQLEIGLREESHRQSPLSATTKVISQDDITLSIVVPSLNEESTIAQLLKQLERALAGWRYNVVVVDGHSVDGTAEIAKNHEALVVTQRHAGYGDALSYGFQYAATVLSPNIVVMIDADGTYDPFDIPRLLGPILDNAADLVIGNRFPRMKDGAMSLTNRVGNRIISWLCRHLLGIRVSDSQCGLRAFRTELVEAMSCQAQGMSFATEMLSDVKEARGRIHEVPVAYSPRVGETKLSPLKDGVRIVAIILRLLRDCKPLFFFGVLSLLSLATGILFGLDVLSEWLSTGTITRIPTVVLAALLVFTSAQFFSLALIADMIRGLRQRPHSLLL